MPKSPIDPPGRPRDEPARTDTAAPAAPGNARDDAYDNVIAFPPRRRRTPFSPPEPPDAA